MSDFKNRVEEDLGHIADRASPSPTTWDVIQSRIADQVDQPEVEIIMLDSNHTPPRRISARTIMLTAAAVVAVTVGGLVALTRSGDEPLTTADEPSTEVTEGSVTILIQVDFDERPIVGTFEVAEGADVLQCSSGTFVERHADQVNHRRIFTCESGPNEGTFTALWSSAPPIEVLNDQGPWNLEEGSGDFAGLQGGGEWTGITFEDRPESVETYTGEIKYAP
jgi:hypothetical protein